MPYLFIFLAYFIPLYLTLDPDFGWHVKLGELTLRNGFSYIDPFSYTMPGFPFIDHEWLTNIIFYLTNSVGGTALLASVVAAAATFSGFLALKGRVNKISLPLYLLAISSCIFYASINPQLFSWILLSIFLFLAWRKFSFLNCFLIISLIVIWTNLHGSFALGVVLLLLILSAQTLKQPQYILRNLAFFFAVVIATFINPYGAGIWVEIYRQISDVHLKWTISEWRPIYLSVNFPYLVFLGISSALIYKFRKIFETEKVLVFLFLTAMSLSTVRHIPLWTVASLPLTAEALEYFSQTVKKKSIRSRFNKTLNFSLIITAILFVFSWGYHLKFTALKITESNYYPKAALAYVRENPTEGNIFAPSEWGGYLILNYPGKKVFIDGRMPSWRDHNKAGESEWADKEYLNIVTNTNYLERAVRKYDITEVVWFNPAKKGNPKIYTEFPQKIEQSGYFVKEYEDANTVVYSRKKEFFGWIPGI